MASVSLPVVYSGKELYADCCDPPSYSEGPYTELRVQGATDGEATESFYLAFSIPLAAGTTINSATLTLQNLTSAGDNQTGIWVPWSDFMFPQYPDDSEQTFGFLHGAENENRQDEIDITAASPLVVDIKSQLEALLTGAFFDYPGQPNSKLLVAFFEEGTFYDAVATFEGTTSPSGPAISLVIDYESGGVGRQRPATLLPMGPI